MNQLTTLQQKASEYLIADPGALQTLLLIQLNACRLHQSVLAAAESCGCARLGLAPTPPPDDWDCQTPLSSGDDMSALCPTCREKIYAQLGALLFYTAALCNALGMPLADVCDREINKLNLLGYFL